MSLIATRRRDAANAPKRVQRFDRAEATLDPPERTAQGYLRTHAAIAVPGVMEYQDANGKITLELVPPEELHDPESLATAASMPVTLQHPDDDVTPENVGTLGVGDVGEQIEVLRETGHVRVVAVIRRQDALDAIGDGVVEVSPGYTCFMDPTPGIHPEFGRYDAIQRGRRYNHLAIVDEARGGPTVKLRADAALSVRRVDAAKPPPRPGVVMNPLLLLLASRLSITVTKRADGKYVKSDGTEITEEQLGAMIDAAVAKAMAAPAPAKGADVDTDPAKVAALTEELTAAKAKVAELEGMLATMKADAKRRQDAEDAAADKAEQAKLDVLAKKIGFDSKSWRADTKTADRKLDLARHAKVIKTDETPAPETVNGMIVALESLNGGTEQKHDSAWQGVGLDTTEPPADTNGPASSRKDRKADPFKAAIEKRRAAQA